MLNSPLEQFIVMDCLPLTIFNLDFLFINLLVSLSFQSFIYWNSSKKNYMQKFSTLCPAGIPQINSTHPDKDLRDALLVKFRTSHAYADDEFPYLERVGSVLPVDAHFFLHLNNLLSDVDIDSYDVVKSTLHNLTNGVHDSRLSYLFVRWADGPTRAFVRRLLVGDFDTFEKASPIVNILIYGSIGVTDPSVVITELFNALCRTEYATAAIVEPNVELGSNFFPKFDPQEHIMMFTP